MTDNRAEARKRTLGTPLTPTISCCPLQQHRARSKAGPFGCSAGNGDHSASHSHRLAPASGGMGLQVPFAFDRCSPPGQLAATPPTAARLAVAPPSVQHFTPPSSPGGSSSRLGCLSRHAAGKLLHCLLLPTSFALRHSVCLPSTGCQTTWALLSTLVLLSASLPMTHSPVSGTHSACTHRCSSRLHTAFRRHGLTLPPLPSTAHSK